MKIQSNSVSSFPRFGMALAKGSDNSATTVVPSTVADRFGKFFEPTDAERQDIRAFAKRILSHLDSEVERGALDKYSPSSGGSRGPVEEADREVGRPEQYRTHWPFPLPYDWQTTYHSKDRTLKFTLMDHSIKGEAFDPKTGELIHSVEYRSECIRPALVESVRVRPDGSQVTIRRNFETGRITAIIDEGGRHQHIHIEDPFGRRPLHLTKDEEEKYGDL